MLRQTGDCLVELCQSEGLPSSLQPLLVAVDDTVELGHLSAGDLAQWAREQRRDMGRLGKHLREVRGTVQPLTDRLTAAEKEGEKAKDRLERAQEGAKKEREKYLASKRQMELLLREAQRSLTEKERRLQEEQQRLLRSTVTSPYVVERTYMLVGWLYVSCLMDGLLQVIPFLKTRYLN